MRPAYDSPAPIAIMPPSMQALSIRNLAKTYKGGTVALRGIDLDVAPGEFFGLLGPNGAGKSTTIGIVTSLVNKTGGTAHVFGHDIDRDFPRAKTCMGLVPQEFNFNQFEPVEQVVVQQGGYYGIPRALATERAERYLKQLGLWGKRKQPSRNLSGGMKRRLMIARALVHEPRLLILDEPTAGVDIELRRSMWQFLREINAQGTTIILTTHYLEEAESLCKRIAIIDDGRIIENTSTRELLQKLDVETFVLDLRQSITQPPALNGFSARMVDEHTIEVDVCKNDAVNSIFGELSRQGVDVLSMRNKANRLEELFVRLTGNSDGADDE